MLRVLSHIAPSQRHKISLSLFWPDENARTLTVSLFKPATRLRQPRRVRPLDLCAIRPQGSLQKRLAITTHRWYLLCLALEAVEKGEALGVGLEESSDRGSESHPVRSWGIYKLYRVFTYDQSVIRGELNICRICQENSLQSHHHQLIACSSYLARGVLEGCR